MPRIYHPLDVGLDLGFYACDHRGKPYPATLLRIESLADIKSGGSPPLLDDCG